MRAPRESGRVDTRLDACPRQRRQCRAGRPVAASVVRPDRLARGHRHIGKRRGAARVADVVEVAVRRRQPRRPCRPDAAQRRDVAAIRRSRDEPSAGAGAVRRRRTAARSGSGGGDRGRRALHVGLPHRDILLSGPCRLRRRVCDPHERHSRTLRHQVLRTDPGADFRLRAALRARCADDSRGSAGGGPRRRISRHPPDHPRASSALHLRALRRSLCRFGDLLRRRRLALQDADLQSRRSGRASLPAGVARGGRNAAAPPRQPSHCRSSGPLGYRSRSAITDRASFCPAPDFAARAAARITRSIRRSVSRSPTRRPLAIRSSTSAAAASTPN